MINRIVIIWTVFMLKIMNFFRKPFGTIIWMEVDIYDFTDSFIEEIRNEIQDAKDTGKGYGYCYNDLKESADEFYDAYHIKVVGWEELLRKEWDLIKA